MVQRTETLRRSRHRRRTLTVLLVVIAGTFTTTGVSAETGRLPGASSNEPSLREIVVRRNPGQSTKAARAHLAERYTLEHPGQRLLGAGFEVIRFTEPLEQGAALGIAAELVAKGLVASAEPNWEKHSTLVPNDPLYSQQWYLQGPGRHAAAIDLPAAWDISRGAANIVVAVIDTGRGDHPELQGRAVDGYDFISRERDSKDGDGWDDDETDLGDWSDPNDPVYRCTGDGIGLRSSWHGTGIAGVIAANGNDSTGITGIAPNVRVQHIRILGTCGGTTSDQAAGIRWAAGIPVPGTPTNLTPAKVINMSLGSATACNAVEQQAINDAVAAGAIVVVSAGNSNSDLDTSDFAPAECDNVITVAALSSDGGRAAYSNYGSKVDIAAPGGPTGIISLTNGGTREATANWTHANRVGTSMAAPVVSGVVALMTSINPSLDHDDVEAMLKASARPFLVGVSSPCSSDPSALHHCGAGIVDPVAALQMVAARSSAENIDITRVGAGGDIFETNLDIASRSVHTDVILVSGTVYPDGLAAAALAKQEDAAIILVPKDGLGSAQIEAIRLENPRTVWIVGGPQAVPESVETQLTAPAASGGGGIEPANIERVYGPTRYETAVEVAKRIQTIAYLAAKPTAIVVRGDNFADAVIAGPATYGIPDGVGSHPILLVHRDSIPAGVVEQLSTRGITNVLIVGGTGVVSETVRLGIESLGITVTRLAGPDRYGTAAALTQLLITPIVDGGFGWNPGNVALVDIADTSQGFDAISAVNLLGPTRRPVLGAGGAVLPAQTATYLSRLSSLTRQLTVIGNERAVSPGVVSAARVALASPTR